MLKKSASGVLASLKGSIYHRARAAKGSSGRVGEMTTPRPLRHWALTGSRPSADVTLIILRVADLAAALLDGLFEHPEDVPVLQPVKHPLWRLQPPQAHFRFRPTRTPNPD